MLSQLEFIITETFLSLRRHPMMAFAAFTCIAATLFVGGIMGLAFLNANYVVHQQLDRVRFKVYFRPPLARNETQTLFERIKAMPLVADAEFNPKEEAWGKYTKDDPKTDISLLDNKNPLPDAVTVKPHAVADIPALQAEFRTWPQVDAVQVKTDVNTFLQKVQHLTGRIGVVLGIILLLLSLVIVHHTIELTLYARRKEVDIMSLVGASPAIVALPFVLEGALYGVIGGGIAFGGLLVLYRMFTGMMKHDIGANMWHMSDMLQQGALALILAGILLGIIGSTLSVTKYMRRPRSKMTNA